MSTYALDCNTMRRQKERRGLKRITHHTDAELNAAVEKAARKFGDDFYLLLHGIDAYMEWRSRRDSRLVTKRIALALDELMNDDA